jgi:hypothetical protein
VFTHVEDCEERELDHESARIGRALLFIPAMRTPCSLAIAVLVGGVSAGGSPWDPRPLSARSGARRGAANLARCSMSCC